MRSFSSTAGAFLALVMFGCGAADGSTDLSHEDPVIAAQIQSTSTLEIPVTIRGTGKATLRNTVYANPNASETAAVTILTVPGLSATGKVFEPLNAALFADEQLGANVKQVVVLDLPGHGQSTLPTDLPEGVRYGNLTIDDNVDMVIQAIRALSDAGNAPALVVGHGLGALTVAAAQQKLLDSGSKLADLGVRRVLMYAPVPSSGRPWTQPTTAASSNLAQYIQTTDALGAVYTLPPEAWARQGFTTPEGTLAPNTPSPEEVAEKGYAASEPAAALLQLTEQAAPGAEALKRPTVSAGAFAPANGTNLIVLSFSQNVSVPAADVQDFYQHLTGDASDQFYVPVSGTDAVSNMFLTNPEAVLEATRKFF